MGFEPQIDAELFRTEFKKTVKIYPVILMIDVSNSIYRKRQKIQELFDNIISIFKEMEQETDELYSTKVAVMIISDEPHWVKDISSTDCYSNYTIQCENAKANFSEALAELNRKLSRREFLLHNGKIACPIIVLITDDENPFANCSEQIETLNNNGWFTHSNRLVYILESEKNSNILFKDAHKFVSGPEGLLFDASDLQKKIWSLKPRTIGGKNSFVRKLRHDIAIGADFVESDFGEWSDDFSGFGGIGDGDFL